MKKIRFGIVGVGNQGTYYANILKEGKVTNGILVGLCDNDPSKIEKAKNNFKNAAELQYFSNYKDLINANICDVIMVETPHYYQRRGRWRFCQHGKENRSSYRC